MKTYIIRITRKGQDILRVIRARSRNFAIDLTATDFPGYDRITIIGEAI